MVRSKLTLLALASTAFAGVVRREKPEVDSLNPEVLPYRPPPDWVTPTAHHSEETGPSSTAFVQAFSDHSRKPHSTYLPSGLPSHFPQPIEEALPPFITSFPGAGEFAHTRDSAKPASLIATIPHPAPPGASYDRPPPSFSDPVRPEEPELNTPPPAFQSPSGHPLIPSSQAKASPTEPPSFTDGQPIPSVPASANPTEPWEGLDPVKPTGFPEIPSWISHFQPPSQSTPGPGELGYQYTAPSVLPEAFQSPTPLPFDSITDEASEPHGDYPASPHQTPDETKQEPHSPPFYFASGKPDEPDSRSPGAAHQLPPPHGSYQEPPTFNPASEGPSGESSPPAESDQTTSSPESYHGLPPTFTVPVEQSHPEGSPPAGPHQLIPPPTEPYQDSYPPPFVSPPGGPAKPESSSFDSYQLPPPSSPRFSHTGETVHAAEPSIPHGGPSPHYGAFPSSPCTHSELGEAPVDMNAPHSMGNDEQRPHSGETNSPPFNPPFESDKEPHDHEVVPSKAVPTLEKPSVTHTDTYVPKFWKPEPTVTEAPSISHAASSPTMSLSYTEVQSKPAIPSPTSGKPQLQGTTGEYHFYGSTPSAYSTEASDVAERPSSTKATPESSRTGVPKAGDSAVHHSSLAPASAVSITALLGAPGALIFFFFL